jgi:hypothetical protein
VLKALRLAGTRIQHFSQTVVSLVLSILSQ